MPFTQQGYYLNENATHSSFRERKPAPRMNFVTFAPPPVVDRSTSDVNARKGRGAIVEFPQRLHQVLPSPLPYQ